MQVELLFAPTHQEALDLLYSACRQCYYSGFVGDKYPFSEISNEEKHKLLRRVISSGHHSVLEHVSFTFGIKDLSRAAAQQLTRHRLASYSMQSMRYNNVSNSGVVIPITIKSEEDKQIILDAELNAKKYYWKLVERGVPYEDARSILLINWKSSLVMTMNCRELIFFLAERLCRKAQREIRDLAGEILRICKERLPEVFENTGAKCEINGYCNEGSRSCHRYPLKEEILKFYYENKSSERTREFESNYC